MKQKPEKSLTIKAGSLAIGKAIKRAIATATVIVLIRLLTKEDFGSFRQVKFIIGFAVALIQFNIPKSLFYFVPKATKIREKHCFISQSFIIITCLGIFSAVILYFASDYIGLKFNNTDLSLLLKRFAPAIIFLAVSQNFFSAVLISLGKYEYASYSYIFIGMPNAIVIVAAALLNYSLLTIFTLSLTIIVLQYLILLILMRNLNVPIFRIPYYNKLREQSQYVFPLSLAMISNQIAVHIDRLVISLYFTASTFAVYSVGAIRIPFIGNLLEGVNATILPKIAEYNSNNGIEELENLCQRGTRKLALVIFPVFSFFYIFAERFIGLLYTNTFLDATPVFRIFLFGILVKLSLCGVIIRGLGRTKVIFKITLFTLALNVALNFLLVRAIGIIGPALAVVSTSILHQFLLFTWINSATSLKVKSFFPPGLLIRIFLISLAPAFTLYPLTLLKIPSILCVFTAAISYITIYLILLDHFKILLKSEKALIKDTLIRIPMTNLTLWK